MTRFLTKEELEAGLPEILNSPSDNGTLEAIVIRPASGVREELQSCDLSLEHGTHGDSWVRKAHITTDEGRPHPDVQICIMNSRCISLIAQDRDRWKLAGDNLFVDLDLRPQNLSPGQRLAIGEAVIEVTAEPHNGCAAFVERYGQAALVFVNGPRGKSLRLRGIYARVVQDGRVTAGDTIVKVN